MSLQIYLKSLISRIQWSKVKDLNSYILESTKQTSAKVDYRSQVSSKTITLKYKVSISIFPFIFNLFYDKLQQEIMHTTSGMVHLVLIQIYSFHIFVTLIKSTLIISRMHVILIALLYLIPKKNDNPDENIEYIHLKHECNLK
jgi:hypothetical protein